MLHTLNSLARVRVLARACVRGRIPPHPPFPFPFLFRVLFSFVVGSMVGTLHCTGQYGKVTMPLLACWYDMVQTQTSRGVVMVGLRCTVLPPSTSLRVSRSCFLEARHADSRLETTPGRLHSIGLERRTAKRASHSWSSTQRTLQPLAVLSWPPVEGLRLP